MNDVDVRSMQFLEIRVEALINPPGRTGMHKLWSINPYIGCELGCRYCYARDTHRAVVSRTGQGDPDIPAELDFERRIFVKTDAAEVLAHTLPPLAPDQAIVIGCATDPYQPAERRFQVTRRLLMVLAEAEFLRIQIVTKSPLIARDLDVLERVAERNQLEVCISCNTTDRRLARRLEPRAPTPDARLRVLGRLVRAGIRASLLVAPILPGITDGEDTLDALLAAAKTSGAASAIGGVMLHLAPGVVRQTFWAWLSAEFPDLVPLYEHLYREAAAEPQYQQLIAGRFDRLARKHELAGGFRGIVPAQAVLAYRPAGDT